jgi:hypothetical protein
MKKINWTVIALTAIAITELIVNKNMHYSFWLWILYGIARICEGLDIKT